MAQVLTDALLRAQQASPEGRVELSDLRAAGLVFRVTSNGARSWSFRFRDPASGKPARFTIGPYPTISLKDARERAEGLRGKVAAGVNPVAENRHARAEAPNKTLRALAARYLEEHAKRKKRSWRRDEAMLNRHVLPKWGERPYVGISRADVIELLEGLMKAGTPIVANRVQSLISGVFSFAIDAGLRADNPCTRLKKRGEEQTRDRVLSDGELRWWWGEVLEPPLSRRLGLALRLVLLTGCRVNEVAGIARSELAHIHDPARAEWAIPAERVKNKRVHLVPLSPAARDIVLELLAQIGPEAEDLIPNRMMTGPTKGHTLTNLMPAFGGRAGAPASWRADLPTAHDLRRTVETRMSALGVSSEDRDAVLNHVRQGVGAKHYDRYDRAAEKRRALCLWASALDVIVTGSTATVLPMRRGQDR